MKGNSKVLPTVEFQMTILSKMTKLRVPRLLIMDVSSDIDPASISYSKPKFHQ